MMNKTEFVSLVAKNAGISKKAADAVVSATFETIKKSLADGEKVQLPGFGTFEVRVRSARSAMNPRTHEKIEIPESKYVKFSASKILKERL